MDTLEDREQFRKFQLILIFKLIQITLIPGSK